MTFRRTDAAPSRAGRGLALAILSSGVCAGADRAAAGNDSVFTDLDIRGCAVSASAVPDADPKGKPEPYEWRCKGHGGWNVFVAEGDLRASVVYGRGRTIDGGHRYFPKFSTTGPKVEWRGPVRAGAVEPRAAIVRFLWSVDGKRGSVLAVARLGRGAGDTCVFAYVDAVANRDANALAQQVADEQAGSARCDGEPRYVGAVSDDLR